MPVPIWVLRNKFEPRGIHLRKRERPRPPVSGFVPTGPHAPWWDRCAFKKHPGDDENSDVRAALARYDEKLRKQRAGWRMSEATLGGNLSGTEYQFWIGMPFEESKLSTCRWCGKTCFGKEERAAHQNDPEVLKANDGRKSCCKMLQDSYRIITKATTHCIFCGKKAYKARWGVWLCCKECEDAWKFNHSRKYPFGRRNADILVL